LSSIRPLLDTLDRGCEWEPVDEEREGHVRSQRAFLGRHKVLGVRHDPGEAI
jgi:hypothetical protein